MKIGIIGAGMIGGTMSRLLVRAGHEVAVSNRRGAESLKPLVDELGPQACALSVEEAAAWADLVLLAVPWRTPEALPSDTAVAGKIVIDAMNPYGADGGIVDLGDLTSSEETARRLPRARLVKAFNTIYFEHLAEQGRSNLPEDERRAIFIAGDDVEAKQVVARLISDLGFAAVDTGTLRDGGRKQQPGSPLYNRAITAGEARALAASA